MSFEVIPAVDVLDGRVVRLERGSFDRVTVYGDDPVAAACRWAEEGAPRLHVVDLDGARQGGVRQREVVRAIVRAAEVPVQVGGGIRKLEDALPYLDAGVDRVVVGTAGAVDALGREVRTRGWQEGTGEDVAEASRRIAQGGARRLLVTDIARDGMLAGPDVGLYTEVAQAAGIPVVASGGVSSCAEVAALARVPGVEAVVVGRALYTGRLDLREALAQAARR